MKRSADVIIAGAGMAGLFAAYHAAKSGAQVIVLAAGSGTLGIGSSCIDILGYVNGTPVTGNPLDSIAQLPATHPYRLIGKESVQQALYDLMQLCADNAWPLNTAQNGNLWVTTIMGTQKPTGACPQSVHPEAPNEGKHIAVIGFCGMRDCQPTLVAEQIKRLPQFADATITPLVLPVPHEMIGRNINTLDLARYLNTPAGMDWFVSTYKRQAPDADTLLTPAICGTAPNAVIWKMLCKHLGATVMEMPGMPPGVGGLRLEKLLLQALHKLGVTVQEKTRLTCARTRGTTCQAFVCEHGNEYLGKSFILATGGFLGNGMTSGPGHVQEEILNLPIPVPHNLEEWSDPKVFGPHAFAKMGVVVNNRLAPVNAQNEEIFTNVHVAGRALAGYDFISEKSGNGVALSTGRYAAVQALEL